jgi:hypothetical protein
MRLYVEGHGLYVYFAFGVVLFGFGDLAWGYIWWMMDCMHNNTAVDQEQIWKGRTNKIKIEVIVAPLKLKVVLSPSTSEAVPMKSMTRLQQ